jgi:8-oxo-dGTP diphosphatase
MWESRAGAGALVVYEGKILMVLHERSQGYRWELPSGYIEAKETLEHAAIRETKEETGVDIVIERLLCTIVMDVPSIEYRGVNMYFLGTVVGIPHLQGPSDGECIKDVAFIDLSQIKWKDIHPVDRRIITRWQKNKTKRVFFSNIILSFNQPSQKV